MDTWNLPHTPAHIDQGGYCNLMMMRDGYGEDCGRLISDPIHSPVAKEAPPTTTINRVNDCIAGVVDGTIVAYGDVFNLGYLFSLVFAWVQYQEKYLSDAHIAFFRASTNPSSVASLDAAVKCWEEDTELLELFMHADIPDIMDINEIFSKTQEFAEKLKDFTLQELFGDVGIDFNQYAETRPTETEAESVQVRAS